MELIEYNNYDDVVVRFLPPYECKRKTKIDHFKNGDLVNPYAPTICGFGIVGNKYPTHKENGKTYRREYLIWTNMIKRCYDEAHRYKNPAYINCECDLRWQKYEDFYEWLHSQPNYDILDQINDLALDKDILIKGNRIYGPDECCLVTQNLNNIMLKSDAIRGDFPIGVHYHKVNNKYVAQCGGKRKHSYLGSFPTVEEAFDTYKQFKEKEIKKLAQTEYELGHITEQCYQALMNYKVEITD